MSRRWVGAVAGGLLAIPTRAIAAFASAARLEAGSPPPSVSRARHVLVVRLDEIGDVVLTTAFLRALRRAAPQARITAAVNAVSAPLLAGSPHVDDVVAVRVAGPRWTRPLVLPWRVWRAAQDVRRRAGRPDLALLPRWGADAAFATYLAVFSRADVRVGFSERVDAHKRRVNRGFDALLTHPLPFTGWRHDVEHAFDLLRFVGGTPGDVLPDLPERPADAAAAEALLADVAPTGWSRRPLVAVCPSGGHSPLKQWPVDRMGALARRLADEDGARVIVVGGPGEEALGASVCAAAPAAHSLVGRTTLAQLAAVLRRCDLFVGNDAGPMHIAAAAGTPVVAIFGPSDSTRFGPRGPSVRVVADPPVCAPMFQPTRPDRCTTCMHSHQICLDRISVDDVLTACRAALALPTPDAVAAGGTAAARGGAL